MSDRRADPKTITSIPSVWDRQQDIRKRLGQKTPAVFLDYDGTLTPIVDDYSRAILAVDMRATMVELAKRCTVGSASPSSKGTWSSARCSRSRFTTGARRRTTSSGSRRSSTRSWRTIRGCAGGGKNVFQVQPRTDWDKGHAVRWLLDRLGLDLPVVLPVYIGDDVTDEDVMRFLGRLIDLERERSPGKRS